MTWKALRMSLSGQLSNWWGMTFWKYWGGGGVETGCEPLLGAQPAPQRGLTGHTIPKTGSRGMKVPPDPTPVA